MMEPTLQVEHQGLTEAGENVWGALQTIGENAGHIKQGLARLKGMPLAILNCEATIRLTSAGPITIFTGYHAIVSAIF